MLISLGVDFRKTPLETREQLLEPFSRLESRAFPDLGLDESVSIQTCNRIEIYGWSPRAQTAGPETVLVELAERWTSSAFLRDQVLTGGTSRSGDSVSRHLFRVAGGLESQILGDIHILGQVRRGYRDSRKLGTVGPHLHRLFDVAIRAGKRVRSETELMSGRRSVGSEAAHLALQRVQAQTSKPRAVVVGCGKVGSHAARALAGAGTNLVLVNRSPERARDLAEELGCGWAPWTRLRQECAKAHAVLVATDAGHYVLDVRDFPDDSDKRRVVLDLSMPRNVDPAVGTLHGVTLLDLDRLNPRIAAVEQARLLAVSEAEWIVDEETRAYRAWLNSREAGKALQPLRETLTAICEREVQYATKSEQEVASRTASRIVSKIMASPMEELREVLRDGGSVEPVAEVIRALFKGARS